MAREWWTWFWRWLAMAEGSALGVSFLVAQALPAYPARVMADPLLTLAASSTALFLATMAAATMLSAFWLLLLTIPALVVSEIVAAWEERRAADREYQRDLLEMFVPGGESVAHR